MKIYVKDEQTVFRAVTQLENIINHYQQEGHITRGKFKGCTRLNVKLKIKDSSGKYGRRSPWTVNKDGSRKKIASVCYHGHYDFMTAIFEREPDATIITAMERYNGKEDFEVKARELFSKNIGSQMQPVNFGDACECERSHPLNLLDQLKENIAKTGYKKILAIYDHPETFDRYSVYFDVKADIRGNFYEVFGMSSNPTHPQGFGQWSSGQLGPHNGKNITFDDLPEECRQAIENQFKTYKCEDCGIEYPEKFDSMSCCDGIEYEIL